MSLKTKILRKKRRSLVRLLASFVPNFLWEYIMPIVPRMYINPDACERLPAFKPNNFQLDDSNSSFCSYKSFFHNRKQPNILNSTPKKDDTLENIKIKALQRELEDIKKQVAKLMERQSEHLQCSDYGTLSNPSEQMQKSYLPPAPPSLPPPPPPLPSIPLITINTPLKVDNKKKNLLPESKNGFPYGKELLKELKKVQLKKVEKSPGGGPVKKPKTDPGDFLEAVLKKRFGRMQNSPNSSHDSASLNANDSFGCELPNGSYELQKSMKASVT